VGVADSGHDDDDDAEEEERMRLLMMIMMLLMMKMIIVMITTRLSAHLDARLGGAERVIEALALALHPLQAPLQPFLPLPALPLLRQLADHVATRAVVIQHL
jgi:hypothetical protein